MNRVIKKVKAWSYSAWKLYDQCPAKYKYEKILKLDTGPEPEVFKYGNKVHGKSEAFLKGVIKKLPPELEKLKDSFLAMKKLKPLVEKQIAFNDRWEVLSDYWSEEVWLRVKADILAYHPPQQLAIICDVKTGKIRKENLQQLELYVPTAFEMFPEALECITEAWYTDQGQIVSPGLKVPKRYTREDVPGILANWEKSVEPMFNDQRFAPDPSMKCTYCPFSKEKGGPCEY